MTSFTAPQGTKPVNEDEFKDAAAQARNLVYGMQRAGMDGLDAALGMLQATHEFVHWNVGEEGEDAVRSELSTFFRKGKDSTGHITSVAASEISNQIWELLFGATAGNVPESLTDELLNEVAVSLLAGYNIERKSPAQLEETENGRQDH